MKKEGWGEQQIWGSPAGTTLGTHRWGVPFVFRARKKLSWGCGTWFAGSAQAWISGPVVHPKLSGAPSTDQVPLWSRKGRATLFMWPVPLPDRCRFCRRVQGLNPSAELGFRWTWVHSCTEAGSGGPTCPLAELLFWRLSFKDARYLS